MIYMKEHEYIAKQVENYNEFLDSFFKEVPNFISDGVKMGINVYTMVGFLKGQAKFGPKRYLKAIDEDGTADDIFTETVFKHKIGRQLPDKSTPFIKEKRIEREKRVEEWDALIRSNVCKWSNLEKQKHFAPVIETEDDLKHPYNDDEEHEMLLQEVY